MNTEDPEIVGGNECILLVDEEVAILEMNSKLLSRLGYWVVSTSDS
ncbi:hypothetical protein [Desulfosediminicola flagellatus]|nr:hypothetical protein [Desulfosediminicola flagellatus]